MKHVICKEIPQGIEHLHNGATVFGRELHFIVDDDSLEISNSVYEYLWDGKSRRGTVLKGDATMVKHAYAGWPNGG